MVKRSVMSSPSCSKDGEGSNKTTIPGRRTAALLALLDAIEERDGLPTQHSDVARDAALAVLRQFSDETLRELMHKLYYLAEAEARERTSLKSTITNRPDARLRGG